jgi:uncharacterized membrane protein
MASRQKETTIVAFAKTLSFTAVHFTVAFAVVYALTGSLLLGGAVALIEPTCNIVAYYLHERAWAAFGMPRLRPGTMPV